MTPENMLVLVILAGAVILFISDWLRVDVVALLVLVVLIVSGLVTPEEAFAGFASPAVVTVWAVFIISGGLFESGVADLLGQTVLKLAGESQTRLLIAIMLTAGIMSAFMNNVGAVAILLPAVMAVSRRLNIAPSKLLMPLAFSALLGGNMTLIGTPPNILAADILRSYGGIEPFTFFDFLPMGVVVLTAGIIYMIVVGRYLLPERHSGDELVDNYPVREYVTEVRVGVGSPLIGGTVAETKFGERFDLTILRVRHHEVLMEAPTAERPLSAGDVLLIEGEASDLLEASVAYRLELVNEWQAADWHPSEQTEGLSLVEITLAPRSLLKGQTLKEMKFRKRFGIGVIAIRHQGESLHDHLGDIAIDFGDALLVQGTPDKLNLLRGNEDFIVLEEVVVERKRIDKAPAALTIIGLVLLSAVLGWFDTSTTMVMGALGMVLFKVLTMDEAYRAIDWKAVFLIAGMLPLGTAMEQTGTAALLAEQITGLIGNWGATAVLGGIFILTALLTEVISNAAATVLMVPIAVDAAVGLGVDPRPLVMGTVLAASTSFLMPVGHQVNVIIYGPGGYRFTDYARVGIGLNLLMVVLAVTVLPLVWPF